MATKENAKTEENAKAEENQKFDPSKKRIVKALTLPVLSTKIKTGETQATIYFFAAGPIKARIAEEVDKKTGEVKSKEVHVMTVLSLMDEKPYTVVLSAAALGNLTEEYPNNGYIGKCFELTSFGKINGKDYNTIAITEIAGNDGTDYEAIAKSFGVFESAQVAPVEEKAVS